MSLDCIIISIWSTDKQGIIFEYENFLLQKNANIEKNTKSSSLYTEWVILHKSEYPQTIFAMNMVVHWMWLVLVSFYSTGFQTPQLMRNIRQ